MLAAGITYGEEKCVKRMKVVVDEAAIVGNSNEHTHEGQVEICAKRCRYHHFDFDRKATLHQHLTRSSTLLPSYRQGLSPDSNPGSRCRTAPAASRRVLNYNSRTTNFGLGISKF
jgi:hypothetical protein